MCDLMVTCMENKVKSYRITIIPFVMKSIHFKFDCPRQTIKLERWSITTGAG